MICQRCGQKVAAKQAREVKDDADTAMKFDVVDCAGWLLALLVGVAAARWAKAMPRE